MAKKVSPGGLLQAFWIVVKDIFHAFHDIEPWKRSEEGDKLVAILLWYSTIEIHPIECLRMEAMAADIPTQEETTGGCFVGETLLASKKLCRVSLLHLGKVMEPPKRPPVAFFLS